MALGLGAYVAGTAVPKAARDRACDAFVDTVGVILAGAAEPAARSVQAAIAAEGGQACTILGAALRANPSSAALANGTAAHALDYDDMCFVSLAHPSAPLVPAVLAVAELTGCSGQAALDAYAIGFELQARLGRAMNPRHYRRGWHCTSTLGTIATAGAASRLLQLKPAAVDHALAIAASEACGLKENFGSMVKPLHAGLAARNGVLAALLARAGMTASESAFEGAQGFLRAFDAERSTLAEVAADLGTTWELLETGITVKLYPSCAATHPALDAILAIRAETGLRADEVVAISVDVDSVTPTVLIHSRPATGLEAKFSMPFCVAAAVVDGRVEADTFTDQRVREPRIARVMHRIAMLVDREFDGTAAPLTRARVRISLSGGRVLSREALGARGYPEQPASRSELDAKFIACARVSLAAAAAERSLERLRSLDHVVDVRSVLQTLRAQ
jgi:2-methylcitrate dehydratase PrpD